MTSKLFLSAEELRVNDKKNPAPVVKVLAVGDPAEWKDQGNLLPSSGISFVSFSEVTEDLISQHRPRVVFSPVLARSFDCIELAILLCKHGFTGGYRAMAESLPKPELIEREVRQLCPRIDFKIVKII